MDDQLANIAWKKIRRHPDKHFEITTAISGLPRLQITRVPVPVGEVLSLAIETGLTAYDASYLWLACSRDLELVTLDDRLARINQARRERHVQPRLATSRSPASDRSWRWSSPTTW